MSQKTGKPIRSLRYIKYVAIGMAIGVMIYGINLAHYIMQTGEMVNWAEIIGLAFIDASLAIITFDLHYTIKSDKDNTRKFDERCDKLTNSVNELKNSNEALLKRVSAFEQEIKTLSSKIDGLTKPKQ